MKTSKKKKKPKSPAFFAYLVRCANGTLYAGTAKDVKTRVALHNSGKGAKYTRAFGPVKLVWKKKFKDRSKACQEEARVKKMARPLKEKLILASKKRRRKI